MKLKHPTHRIPLYFLYIYEKSICGKKPAKTTNMLVLLNEPNKKSCPEGPEIYSILIFPSQIFTKA